METHAHSAAIELSRARTAAGGKVLCNAARVMVRAVRRFADVFSEQCRRIRIYNDVANLRPDAFRQPERRRQVIAAIINGRPRAAGGANRPQHRSIRP